MDTINESGCLPASLTEVSFLLIAREGVRPCQKLTP